MSDFIVGVIVDMITEVAIMTVFDFLFQEK